MVIMNVAKMAETVLCTRGHGVRWDCPKKAIAMSAPSAREFGGKPRERPLVCQLYSIAQHWVRQCLRSSLRMVGRQDLDAFNIQIQRLEVD